jgi:MarR family 2-MHQ and catechol resistance regulon transcriptional repressor
VKESRRQRGNKRTLAAYASLVRATELVLELLTRQLGTFGLTMGRFRVLEALRDGPLSQAEIAAEVSRPDSDVHVVLRNLGKRGLVVRRAHESDRRKIPVQLTPAGEKLIAKVAPLHASVVRARMSALDVREQESLRRMCEKLALGDPIRFLRELMAPDLGDEG